MCAVKFRQNGGFKPGYTSIVTEEGEYRDYLMDFGMLKLNKDQSYDCSMDKERAFVLSITILKL